MIVPYMGGTGTCTAIHGNKETGDLQDSRAGLRESMISSIGATGGMAVTFPVFALI